MPTPVKRGSVYYFRMAVPLDVRSVIGKREFMISLGTKDREDAKRLILFPAAAAQREVAAARALMAGGPSKPSASPETHSPAASRYLQKRFDNEIEAAEHDWQISNEQDERRADREGLRIKRRRTQRGRTADMTREDAAIQDVIDERVEEALAAVSKAAPQTAPAVAVLVAMRDSTGGRASTLILILLICGPQSENQQPKPKTVTSELQNGSTPAWAGFPLSR
ncbi:hypothetical protein BH10PSE14_BH10PSE14_17910 [soil metagenome]